MNQGAALVLLISSFSQQPPSNPGFRLGYVRKVYIESLGTSDAAKLVGDQLVGALLNKTHLEIQNDRSAADAALSGTAILTSGSMHWAVGSATATQTSATAQISAGGRTIRITDLGLRLADMDNRLIWAFDPSHCLDVTTLVLFGVPTKKQAISCAVEQLMKAIRKDAKDAKKAR